MALSRHTRYAKCITTTIFTSRYVCDMKHLIEALYYGIQNTMVTVSVVQMP